MIDIKVYMLMGECQIEVRLSQDHGQSTIDAVRWSGALSATAPLADLCRNITRALEAADGYAGDVSSDIAV